MLNDQIHKTSLYTDETFPFVMFTINKTECIPPGPGYQYLHWHEDLQFTLITRGTVSMQVNGDNYYMHSGEAIFINSGMLHITNSISDDGEYISFNFPAKLLCFFYGSRLEMDYVLPFTSNYSFPVCLLTPDNSWQEQLIHHLWKLKEICSAKEQFGSSYETVIKLTQIWLILIKNRRNFKNQSSLTLIKKQENMQTMLAFIHSNYMTDISLRDISGTVHISQGECCRCFKNMLHITPYEYLIQFRINKSVDLLKETSLSISEISEIVGFNSSSHFISLFKKKMNMTPVKYRKHLT